MVLLRAMAAGLDEVDARLAGSRATRHAARLIGVVGAILALVFTPIAERRQALAADLLAGWDFQTTTGGTAVAASPATPKVYLANFGTGTLYLDGQFGSSSWFVPTTGSTNTELNAFSGSNLNTAFTVGGASGTMSTVTTSPAALALLGGAGTPPAANGKSAVFQFTMTGKQDLAVSYATQRTNTGFTSQLWESSTDGVTWATVITNSSLPTAFGVFALPSVTSLNNAATAFLRVTFNGATASSGNNRLDNIQFNTNPFTPPSSVYTWTGNGAGGTWADGQPGSFGTTYTNNLTSQVTFQGTGETVTVASGVQAGTVAFAPSSGAYTLSGGSLELGVGNNLSVAAGSAATIATAISGTAGLTKIAAGTATLSGANSFTGLVTINEGTVVIGSDGALGNVANDLSINGTLQTTSSLTLGDGRSVTGNGALAIAPGTVLTVAGPLSTSGINLLSTGELAITSATPSAGAITFGAAGRISAANAIAATGLTAPNLTSGTAVVAAPLAMSTGDKTVAVGAGGTLAVEGDIAGTGGSRIVKAGGGTLIIGGSSAMGLRVGTSGSIPTDGGTVVLRADTSSGTSQLQLNVGTLLTDKAGGITLPGGVSVGGREGAVAVLGGTQPITFSGSSSFFRGFGATGELRLDVNNTTTLAGILGPTSGSGIATGVTIGGGGRLVIAGDGSAFADRITIKSPTTLAINGSGQLGSTEIAVLGTLDVSGRSTPFALAAGQTLAGNGAVTGAALLGGGTVSPGVAGTAGGIGSLSMAETTLGNGTYALQMTSATAGAGIGWDLLQTTSLTLPGDGQSFAIDLSSVLGDGTAGPAAGFDPGIAGSWRIIAATSLSGAFVPTRFTVNNGGFANSLAGGSFSVSDSGADGTGLYLTFTPVPEPSTLALLAIGAGLAGWRIRRRKRATGPEGRRSA
ncbi:MAG: beta strand repeat-containing protein [Planctomycetota bacterium]